jgi:hypothetical protein
LGCARPLWVGRSLQVDRTQSGHKCNSTHLCKHQAAVRHTSSGYPDMKGSSGMRVQPHGRRPLVLAVLIGSICSMPFSVCPPTLLEMHRRSAAERCSSLMLDLTPRST